MKQLYLSLVFLVLGYLTGAQTVNFTFQTQDGLYCSPASVSFTQTCTGAPSAFFWEFGDNTNSTLPNPVHVFRNAGTYDVKLTASYTASTISRVNRLVVVQGDSLKVLASRDTICKAGVINFTVGGSSSFPVYTWNFGDGSPVISAGSAVSHSYTTPGVYKVVVKALAPSGCTARDSMNIYYIQPPLNGYITPDRGCIPANAGFFNAVTVPTGDAVISYVWNFGDGTAPVPTVTSNTSHLYTVVGRYFPTMTLATQQGCTASYSLNPVNFGTTMINYRGYLTSDTLCASDIVYAISSADNITATYYNFGDGTNYYSADTARQQKYNQLGPVTVYLSPDHYGCPGPVTALPLFVTGTISSFTDSIDCQDKRRYFFRDRSLGNVTSITWNFGDGTTVNNISAPSHLYTGAGTYQVSVTTRDSISRCSDTYSKTVSISNSSLFCSDTSVCRNDRVVFSVRDSFPRPGTTYEWHLAGRVYGPTTATDITIQPATRGNFINYVLEIVGSCVDTIWLNSVFKVAGPVPLFSSADSLCLSSRLQVVNNSSPFTPGDSIRKWIWNFGANAQNDTAFQPQPYQYTVSGNYTISLSATDLNGCIDTVTRRVRVVDAPAINILNPTVDTLCFGQSKTLIAVHSGAVVWTPATGLNCTTCDTVIATPTVTTMYYATVPSLYGCGNYDSVLVKYFGSFSVGSSFADAALCLGDSLQLRALPANKQFRWSPAAGLSSSIIANPLAFPQKTIVYTALVTDSAGCYTDSIRLQVRVNPLPTINAGADQTYAYGAVFNLAPLYSADVRQYLWSPSLSLTCSNCAFPSGKADQTVAYTITAISDSGCMAKDTVVVNAICKDAEIYMPGAFTPDRNTLNDVYRPLAKGIRNIRRFMVYNRLGQLVYEAHDFPPNDKKMGWNGKFNGLDQPVGVYLYLLEGSCDNAQISRRGSFMLIR